MSKPLPTEVDRKEAGAAMERARLMAAVNLELLVESLNDRLQAAGLGAPIKSLLDAAEFNYKVSGMAARQQAQVEAAKPSIVFVVPEALAARGVVVPGRAVRVEDDPLALPPSHALAPPGEADFL